VKYKIEIRERLRLFDSNVLLLSEKFPHPQEEKSLTTRLPNRGLRIVQLPGNIKRKIES
jgi:hypothetical protein